MADSKDAAINLALAFVRERLWQLDWEPVVANVREEPDYWLLEYNSRQFVEHGDEAFKVAAQPLVVEKSTGQVGIYHPKRLPPWTASWDEVAEAAREFQRVLLLFERRPDADEVLKERAQRSDPLVSEIVLGHPHGWPTRDRLAAELVGVAVRTRDVYFRRCCELLHLLPTAVLGPAVDIALDEATRESNETERWYQLGMLITVCAELALGDQLDRLIEQLDEDPSVSELAERASELRTDENWGTRLSAWPRAEGDETQGDQDEGRLRPDP